MDASTPAQPPTVTVRPSGARFPAGAGQAIMSAGVAAGYRWPTICGGKGDCRVCFIEVLENPEHLSEPEPAEAQAIREITNTLGRRAGQVRLACQAVVHGDVVVHKRGVRPATRNNTEGGDLP
ncbi:2Fe-2S iron-sulfur cluster-binding protein [Nocardia iowensis]|uniref:2Fe-2S iron-sulfur cluster binding domain-containing protein n=1 Tax=Nocardia iowensis TaxID=204891 RepID=A0ABX8RYB1_NOCIO|nr:2Fe-2S iron-sulfur cluster binding domain-containing protein [Nocardia iowensis]QXN94543.1 2Fe-2S iron-sulfur cluster binding domain-containing protein [Nocardia iowensis]